MKNIIIILTLILVTTSLFGQEEIFKQKRDKNQLSIAMQNKINLFTDGNMNKATEILTIKKGLNFKEGYKGVFNIFNEKIEFKILKKENNALRKTQIYDAELKDGGTAIIVNSPEGLSSTVWYKDEVYSIEYLDDENYLVMQKDMVEINRRENRDEIGLNKEMLNYDKELFTTNNRSTIKPKIRILVVYTSQVQNVSNLIIQFQGTTNQAFTNSLINAEVELIDGKVVSYQESGSAFTDVHRFMETNDGYMDDIHRMRRQYKADVCALIVNNLDDYGRVPDNSIPASHHNAFFVVKAEAAVVYLTFTHELGHLLGARHCNDTSLLPFPWGHGFADNLWQIDNHLGAKMTIMSAQDKSKFQRILYFSNPNVKTQNNKPLGTTHYNDNARVLNYFSPIISNFEVGVPFVVSIDGPLTLGTTQTGTYSCVVNNTNPPYTYQWEIMKISIPPAVRSAPEDQWVPVGTNSSTYTKPVPNNGDFRDFKLRCTVKNGLNNYEVSNELYVSYSGQRATNQKIEEQTDGLFVEENLLPEKTELLDNYPNPFNPSTTINYKLKESSWVSLKVYDIQGREIAVLVNEEKPAGSYSNVFNASNLASGIYIYKLITKDYSESKKMLLVK